MTVETYFSVFLENGCKMNCDMKLTGYRIYDEKALRKSI
jgi:hypothetical protein